MRKLLLPLFALFLIAAASGNPHYVVGPDFEQSGNTVTASGSIAGLGNEDIDLTLTVQASVDVQCRNPGGNVAPGQDKAFESSTTITGLEPKNGRVNFTISATADPSDIDLAGACPNRKWTPEPGLVTVISATLEVSHGGVPQPQLTATM